MEMEESLIGTPPSIFSEDRKKAQTFLNNFRGWKAVNYKKEVIKDPYMCAALILTFIKGEDVNSWANHQLKLLDEKITNEKANVESLWQDFEKAFKDSYTFVAAKENTLAQLEGLTMDKN
jgi:hypothetical protein